MKQNYCSKFRVMLLLLFAMTISGISSSLQAQDIQVVGNNLYYQLSNGEAKLLGFYDDEESSLTVPGAITYENQTYPVTSISTGAFTSCPLTTVTLGQNVKVIERRAFSNNKQLTSFSFDAKLDSLGEEVFMNCSKLPEITLPASLRAMNGNTFKGCTALKTVKVDAANPYYTTMDNAVVSKNKEVLVLVSPALGVDGVYSVASGIKELGKTVFMDAPFSQINLPESLEVIAERAFMKAQITSLTIPAGVTSIGDAFVAQAAKLQSITIAEGNNNFEIKETFFIDKRSNMLLGMTTPFTGTDLKFPEGIAKISGYLFNASANLVTVEMPSTLKEIGEQAFTGCAKLETVKLNEGLERIGRLCFFNEASLKQVNFPSTLKQLDFQCFASCKVLPEAKLNEGLEIMDEAIFASCDGLKEVYLPKSLKKFGANMFSFATSLESVNLPEWLEEIPDGTCSNCTSLKAVEIPKGVKRIGQQAFYAVPITKIDLPEELESIEYIAFYNTKIVDLVIPDKVTYIGRHTFGYCAELKSVKFGKSMKTVDALGFNNCVNLQSVEFNEGLESIGDRSFSAIQELETIKLPSTLNNYGPMVFLNSKKLKDIYAYAETPAPITEDDYIFGTMANGIKTSTCPEMTLHVMGGSLEAYKKAPVWSTFGTILGDLAVEDIAADENLTVTDIYDLQGNRHADYVKGVNIVRYSNGKTAKVIR